VTTEDLRPDDRGLLPPGVHAVDTDKVHALFGQIQGSTHRSTLCGKLMEYIEELRKNRIGESIVIDGSFVMTSVDEPSDIDVVVLMPAKWSATELRPIEEHLLGRSVRRRYRVEVTPAVVGSEHAQNRIEFYRQVNPKWCQAFGWQAHLQKGLVEVRL